MIGGQNLGSALTSVTCTTHLSKEPEDTDHEEHRDPVKSHRKHELSVHNDHSDMGISNVSRNAWSYSRYAGDNNTLRRERYNVMERVRALAYSANSRVCNAVYQNEDPNG